jgi:hypothetical protein
VLPGARRIAGACRLSDADALRSSSATRPAVLPSRHDRPPSGSPPRSRTGPGALRQAALAAGEVGERLPADKDAPLAELEDAYLEVVRRVAGAEDVLVAKKGKPVARRGRKAKGLCSGDGPAADQQDVPANGNLTFGP